MSASPNQPPLTFHVVSRDEWISIDGKCYAVLKRDRWDDWGEFCTQFHLVIVDAQGEQHRIGNLKIGQIGLKEDPARGVLPGHRTPDLPDEFTHLGDQFFSVGQGDDYYEELNALGDPVREGVLRSLRDVALDDVLWEKVRSEAVMKRSLLRSVSETAVERQYHRMARGGARLTPFRFSYTPPKHMGSEGGSPPFALDFSIVPERTPPTNVHVVIGRNGVGKTRVLSLMTKALVAPEHAAQQSGTFKWQEATDFLGRFANLVTVSFSAFDDTEILPEGAARSGGLKYSYVGLRRRAEQDKTPKTIEMLSTEFVNALGACQAQPLRRRWHEGMNGLMTDPVFQSANLSDLIDRDLRDADQKAEVSKVFNKLSSGHKIVALTLTRLVQTVEEKTLVLIDEPEAHLHPPLLSAFVRTLSQLLVDRNGVAVIATHSPVVLQEVPKSCVWILDRVGRSAKAERPSIETFAENVGILTREVFQLELNRSGFYGMLDAAVKGTDSYEEALAEFDGQLGAEGRAVLRAMAIEKQTDRT